MIAAIDSPLVVDLDGTLTPSDTLVESVIGLLRRSPLSLFRLPVWLLGGRARFKESVARRSCIAVELLPYRESLLGYLRDERARGRRVILATAAHRSIADAVSAHLGLFDDVIATEGAVNAKGAAKLDAIRSKVGEDFVYAGDSSADIPIWQAAKGAILVGASVGVAETIRRAVPIEREFAGSPGGLGVWVRALRVHQWLKNLLLFVPLLTAFSFLDMAKVVAMTVAFFSFSFAASATYVMNDLWDLESDRLHPRKRLRPFASASLPVPHGLAVAAVALTLGIVLATAVSGGFLLLLLAYLVLSSSYSMGLKAFAVLDVLVLSLLYTLRILAGSVAVGIVTSSWLLAFSVFMFLSLALVKRCAELVSLERSGLLERNGSGSAPGRDYGVGDLVVLWPLGVGAALSAVVVFGLFISAPETGERYANPQLLWLVAVALIYWSARMWIKTSRGEMDDDPLIFTFTDTGSRLTIVAMVLVTLAAYFAPLESTP